MKKTTGRLRKVLTALASSAVLGATSVHATVVTLQFDDVGTINTINPTSPEAAAGFLLNERLILQATFDDATVDSETNVGDGNFDDPNGFLKLIGVTSGASLIYTGGVEIEVDDDEEFEIESLAPNASATNTSIISGDIDLDTQGTSFFTNPDVLATVVADLLANPFPSVTLAEANTDFWLGSTTDLGMDFGPSSNPTIITAITAVPEPITPALIVLGLGALGITRRRRRRALSSGGC